MYTVYLKNTHLHKPGDAEEFLFKYSRYKLAFRSVVEKTKMCFQRESTSKFVNKNPCILSNFGGKFMH